MAKPSCGDARHPTSGTIRPGAGAEGHSCIDHRAKAGVGGRNHPRSRSNLSGSAQRAHTSQPHASAFELAARRWSCRRRAGHAHRPRSWPLRARHATTQPAAEGRSVLVREPAVGYEAAVAREARELVRTTPYAVDRQLVHGLPVVAPGQTHESTGKRAIEQASHAAALPQTGQASLLCGTRPGSDATFVAREVDYLAGPGVPVNDRYASVVPPVTSLGVRPPG